MGIDPGSTVVGYGVVTGGNGTAVRLLECGILRPDKGAPFPDRLRTIHDGVSTLIERHRPDAVAVEQIFYGKNVRTTVVLGHARGVILLSAAQAGLPIAEYTPAVIKKTVVGRGGAAKQQVGYMVAQLLRLQTAPAPADASDGVAVALTHLLRGAGKRRGAIAAR